MADERTSGIYPLDELRDLKVAEDDVDPRGWSVYSQDGQRVGEVKELLVDTAAMQVRYLEVEVDRGAAGAGAGDNRRVLFPVGTARLDDADDRVFVSASAASVAGLPAYVRGGAVSREHEDAVRTGFVTAAGTTAGTAADPGEVTAAELDYYNHDHYSTANFYGNRRRGGGAADDVLPEGIGDRRAAAPAAAPGARDEEVRVSVNAEEAVIHKRAVVREVLVIKKRAITENQSIQIDLRRERVDVDRDLGGGDRISAAGTATPGTYGTGGTMGDAARAGTGRLADAVDDVKDRVDGNPASRPGPDATDRRP